MHAKDEYIKYKDKCNDMPERKHVCIFMCVSLGLCER